MSDALAFDAGGTLPRDRVHTLFGQTMGLVAVTAGLFAVGAYAGRNLSYKLGILWFLVAIACLFGMRPPPGGRAPRRSPCCSPSAS